MLIRYSNLDQVVSTCEAMHERASNATMSSWRAYYARGFFEKAMLHGRSISSLIHLFQTKKQALDIAGICVLSRCILEVHNASSYLLELGLSKEESELRYLLFQLNHTSDLMKINIGLGIKEYGFGSAFNEAVSRSSRDELQNNQVFQSLDEPHRKALLKGKSPYLTARYTGEKPLPRNIESAAYNLFSHNVHSFSLGLHPMHGGSNTPLGGPNMSFLAVELAVIYLSNIALKYWRLRSRAIKTLTQQEKDILNEGASTRHLENWLSNMQSG